jgi:hypothetical protein
VVNSANGSQTDHGSDHLKSANAAGPRLMFIVGRLILYGLRRQILASNAGELTGTGGKFRDRLQFTQACPLSDRFVQF